MANKDPQKVLEKYTRGVQGGAQSYSEGVQNPSRPWAAATAGAAPRWQAGVQEAIQTGAFQRGVQKAGDAKWQQNASTKGAANYAASANFAAQGYGQVVAQVMAAGAQGRSAAQAMPGATQEQRIQRAAASMRAISAFWKQRG